MSSPLILLALDDSSTWIRGVTIATLIVLLIGVVAVFSLSVAVIVRRSAPAITIVLLLLLVPQIVATGLPLSAARWLERLTPAAGFAIQHTVPRFDQAIAPWAGFGVLCGYTAAALAAAAWLIRKRDA